MFQHLLDLLAAHVHYPDTILEGKGIREKYPVIIGGAATHLEIVEEIGANAYAIRLDVADQSSIDAALKTVEEHSGGIDILINNAGILRRDSLAGLDYDGMLEQYRVNTLGPLRVTEALLGNLGEGWRIAMTVLGYERIAKNEPLFENQNRLPLTPRHQEVLANKQPIPPTT